MSPGDLRRLAVTQTPVEDHQLKLMRKNYNNNNNNNTQQNRKCMLYGYRNETIYQIINEASKLVQKRTRLDKSEWGRWFTGNYARNWNMTILPNGICTDQDPLMRIWRIRFSGFWYTNWSRNPSQISRPSDSKKKKNLLNSGRCSSQSETDRKLKDRQVLRPYQLWVKSKADRVFSLGLATSLREVQVDHEVEIKDSNKKKRDNFLTVMPFVTGALGTVSKRFVRRLKELENE